MDGRIFYNFFDRQWRVGLVLFDVHVSWPRDPSYQKSFVFFGERLKSEYKELRHSRICKDEIFIQLEVGVGEILSGKIQVVRL